MLFVSPQVDDAMLMFDKTTNRHRGETTDPSPPSRRSPRLSCSSSSLLLFLRIYRSPPLRPPLASFLWAELEETNGASLISQSVNLDKDKALSTSSPPWD